MSFQPLQINAADLTFERLADFVDRARSHGSILDNPIIVDAVDVHGQPVDVQAVTIEIDG